MTEEVTPTLPTHELLQEEVPSEWQTPYITLHIPLREWGHISRELKSELFLMHISTMATQFIRIIRIISTTLMKHQKV